MKVTKSCLIVVRTRFSYRCLWVFNNSEPVKYWNQWECSTWWRTHKKLCSSMIISRYQGGNTRRQVKVEVGLGYCPAEDKCLNLSEKWDQRRTIWSETTIIDDWTTYTRWTYNKGVIIFTSSFHDKVYILSMGMNTGFKVDSHLFNA